MTNQEWLEARARGLELRRRIEEEMTRALIESGVMKDCFAYIQAAQKSVHPTVATVATPEVESTTRNSG